MTFKLILKSAEMVWTQLATSFFENFQTDPKRIYGGEMIPVIGLLHLIQLLSKKGKILWVAFS